MFQTKNALSVSVLRLRTVCSSLAFVPFGAEVGAFLGQRKLHDTQPYFRQSELQHYKKFFFMILLTCIE